MATKTIISIVPLARVILVLAEKYSRVCMRL